MSASNWVHVDVEKVIRETEKAFLLLIEDEEHWVPKSQMADPGDYEAGDEDVSIALTEFIVREKGFEAGE